MTGLLFVATSRNNVSSSLILEGLQRVAGVIKDYCGVLNEDALRKNFILVYELLDEIMDFGYVQNTTTEGLKPLIFNEPQTPPVAATKSRTGSIFSAPSRNPANATQKSVVSGDSKSGKGRDEIFVDIIEKVSVTFNASGYMLTNEIDGSIMVKSFLNGNPTVRVALNEDLLIGKNDGTASFMGDYGAGRLGVQLDDCNFHSSVKLDDFETERTLLLLPPDGEFALMNYRSTAEFTPPFKVVTAIDETGPYVAELVLKIRAEFPENNSGSNVCLKMPLPKATTRASCQLAASATGQSTEWMENTKTLVWNFKKLAGKSEHVLRCKLTFNQERVCNLKREMGPATLNFTIPMYNPSRLQVRFLQVMNKDVTYNPYRWVRYVTKSNSYVCRI
eukprot:CAMPEP_0197851156 /NCGR_PEP_ID=MMETSP1438-20131217/17406_1 /TAXON_ID=1461541 /ORGANISM="Pterosperma sp., Strain CCMP1384" /LENGTH=389 /DNA_ID=CAMNT_0043464657 /DNA_START=489 /DNA_END=1658 /DNA_ORIENTATION=-